MGWPARYVGLPFVDGGRDRKGVDCWGLVRLVLARECGLDLPRYGEISARDLMAIAGVIASQAGAGEPWRIIDRATLRDFDLAVMHRRRAPVHLGLIAGRDRLLHVERGIDAVLLPLVHPSLAFRAVQFFRHRELA